MRHLEFGCSANCAEEVGTRIHLGCTDGTIITKETWGSGRGFTVCDLDGVGCNAGAYF
jgi:hypothetical protein